MAETTAQKALLAILPKISSVFSFAGSAWVVAEILTHGGTRPKRRHPYHRLLLAMSVYDILECFWNFASTWPIPKDSDTIWSVGNTGTCSAQGFFLMLGVAIPIYNALLAVYYLLVIKHGYAERILRTRVEPAMHLIAGSWAFGTSLAAAFMGLYNDANLWCWISSHPRGCKDSLRYGSDEANCERGDNAWVYQWAFYFAPLWFSVLVAIYCTVTVFIFVRRLDEKSLKYRRPERHRTFDRLSSNMATPSGILRKNQAAFDCESDDDDDCDSCDDSGEYRDMNENDDHHHDHPASKTHDTGGYENNSNSDNTKRSVAAPLSATEEIRSQSFVTTTTNGTVQAAVPPSKSQQDRDQIQDAFSSSITQSHDRRSKASSTSQQPATKVRASVLSFDPSTQSLAAKHELEEDEREDRFLEGGHDSDDNSSIVSRVGSVAAASAKMESMALQLRGQIQTWKNQRKVYRDDYPRTVDVMNQAVFYLGAFFLTHMWSTTNRLLQFANGGETVYALILIHSWFDPFQGFLNFLVYQRPRYLYIRKTRPEIGRWGASVRVLHFSFMKQREARAVFQNSLFKNKHATNELAHQSSYRVNRNHNSNMERSLQEMAYDDDSSLPSNAVRGGSVVSRGRSVATDGMSDLHQSIRNMMESSSTMVEDYEAECSDTSPMDGASSTDGNTSKRSLTQKQGAIDEMQRLQRQQLKDGEKNDDDDGARLTSQTARTSATYRISATDFSISSLSLPARDHPGAPDGSNDQSGTPDTNTRQNRTEENVATPQNSDQPMTVATRISMCGSVSEQPLSQQSLISPSTNERVNADVDNVGQAGAGSSVARINMSFSDEETPMC